jgi:hypothetical protein
MKSQFPSRQVLRSHRAWEVLRREDDNRQRTREVVNKRLEKRHKRHVLRARERVNLSQPDLRTAEQLKAAREASRRKTGPRIDSHALYSTPVKHEAGA